MFQIVPSSASKVSASQVSHRQAKRCRPATDNDGWRPGSDCIVSRTVRSELWGRLRQFQLPRYQTAIIFSAVLPPRGWSAPEARRSRWRSKWESYLQAVKIQGSSKAIPPINDGPDAKLWLDDQGNLVGTKLGFFTRSLWPWSRLTAAFTNTFSKPGITLVLNVVKFVNRLLSLARYFSFFHQTGKISFFFSSTQILELWKEGGQIVIDISRYNNN